MATYIPIYPIYMLNIFLFHMQHHWDYTIMTGKQDLHVSHKCWKHTNNNPTLLKTVSMIWNGDSDISSIPYSLGHVQAMYKHFT